MAPELLNKAFKPVSEDVVDLTAGPDEISDSPQGTSQSAPKKVGRKKRQTTKQTKKAEKPDGQSVGKTGAQPPTNNPEGETGPSSQSKKRKRKRKKKGDTAPKDDAQGAQSAKKELPKKEAPKKDAPAKEAPKKKVPPQQLSTHASGLSRPQRRKEQRAVRNLNRPEALQRKNLRPIPWEILKVEVDKIDQLTEEERLQIEQLAKGLRTKEGLRSSCTSDLGVHT